MNNEPDFVKNEIKTWGPKKWTDFKGAKNRRQVERLQRCAIARRLPLFLLLIGPYGCAKTKLAQFLIKAYRCRHATTDGNPCHNCDDCARQGSDFNSDGVEYPQYEFDCHRYATRTKLQPELECIEGDERPAAVFFDQFEGLNEKAIRSLLKFLDNFKGVFIAAVATDDFQRLKRGVRTMPALAPVFERIRKVYLDLPEIEEMVALLKSKAPEWGIVADDAMLRLMVAASQRSFRTCLDILQAAHENDPPVLDRDTIKEFLKLDDEVAPDELNDDDLE